ncbi:MAG: lipopolysaccharide transport periplasmic protein LptA [Desulfopila sp.]
MTTGLRSFFALFFCTTLLVGALAVSKAMAEDPPITVEADHMTSIEKESSVIFTGEVDARQGNVRIRTDKMIVYYTEKGTTDQKTAQQATEQPPQQTDAKQKVEKMVCNGNVQVTQDDWLGTSKDMVYMAKTRQFVLIGDAKAWQGKNMVSGDKIIYYLDEKRTEVVADNTVAGKPKNGQGKDQGRVKMTIIEQ